MSNVKITYEVSIEQAREELRLAYRLPLARHAALSEAVKKHDAEQKAKRWHVYDKWRCSISTPGEDLAELLRSENWRRDIAHSMGHCFGALDFLIREMREAEQDIDCSCDTLDGPNDPNPCKLCNYTDERIDAALYQRKAAIIAMVPPHVAEALFAGDES